MGRYDAIIVGASYAGLACAAQMPGRQLLVLERHPSVVHKQRGSMGLYLPFGKRFQARGENLYLEGLDLLVEGGIRSRIHRIEIRGFRERVNLPLPGPLIVLNERRVKGALLRRVLQIGAEVRVGSPVREVDSDGLEARVRADEDHQARVLVGADGSQSLVAYSLNLKREKLAVLFQREVELDRLDLQAGTLQIQIDDAGNWFMAVPCGDRFLASVFQVVGPRGVPADLDDRLLDKIERLGGGRRLASRAAIVRILEPSPLSYRDNVVLVGDAQAAYGISTIAGALTQGQLAGAAVNRFLAGSAYALPDYGTRWRKATGQRYLEQLRHLSPLLARIRADRVDRAIRALRGGGRDRMALGSAWIWLRLPAVLMRLLV